MEELCGNKECRGFNSERIGNCIVYSPEEYCPAHEPFIAKPDCGAAIPCNDKLEAIAFLLTLVPEWALNMEQGLDPTYYGTGSYEGDKKVYDKVMEIKGLLKKEM